jgi:hypothetical protein
MPVGNLHFLAVALAISMTVAVESKTRRSAMPVFKLDRRALMRLDDRAQQAPLRLDPSTHETTKPAGENFTGWLFE